MSQQSTLEKVVEEKPKRKYAKKEKLIPVEQIASEAELRAEIARLKSQVVPDKLPEMKQKRALSEKQKEALAAGRAKRLEKLSSLRKDVINTQKTTLDQSEGTNQLPK
jgi:hypothetical protein